MSEIFGLHTIGQNLEGIIKGDIGNIEKLIILEQLKKI